jgi:hypothetical protein
MIANVPAMVRRAERQNCIIRIPYSHPQTYASDMVDLSRSPNIAKPVANYTTYISYF